MTPRLGNPAHIARGTHLQPPDSPRKELSVEGIERLIEPLWDDGEFVLSRMGPGKGHGRVGRLPERGLIHKGVKPANILVHLARCPVTPTSFGISSRMPRERQTPSPLRHRRGTLAYVAPE